MGGALVHRLLGKGIRVLGFDIDPARAPPLAAPGFAAAGSVDEVGRRCSRVVVAVYDVEQVEAVVAQLGTSPHPRIVLCTTTVEPRRIEVLAAKAALAGIMLVELPISGTSAQVRAGQGIGLLAGDRVTIDALGDLLDAICPRRFYLGACGNAARSKLAVNLVLQLNRAALAEGLVFAERLGLAPDAFLEILRASPARSEVMDVKGEKMLRSDFAPQSRIAQTLKDAQLMLDAARVLGQGLPMMEANAALLAASIRQGGGERDSAAVIEAIRASRPA